MINQLIQIISDETVLFEKFLGLLDRQKDALVANDTELLDEITEIQHRTLNESRDLHRKREDIIAAIKEANDLRDDVTVTRLLELADEDQSQRLTQMQDSILSLNDEITRARNTNAMLLNRSRDYISRTMAALARMSNSDKNYRRDGAAPQNTASLAVDRRV